MSTDVEKLTRYQKIKTKYYKKQKNTMKKQRKKGRIL